MAASSASLRKAFGNLAVLVLGLASSVVTARALGSDGKGVVATLILVQGLVSEGAGLGLSDAMTVFVRRGTIALPAAGRFTMGAVLPVATIGAAGTALVLCLAFPDDKLAGVLTAAAIPSLAASVVLVGELYTAGRLGATMVVSVSATAITLALTVVALSVLHLGIAGATGAQTVASLVVLASVWLVARRGREAPASGPSRRAYLRSAVRFGLKTEAAELMTRTAGRADLLLVAVFLGAGAAGNYSIALTVLTVAGTLPTALNWAGFPSLASSGPDDAAPAVAQLARLSLALAALSAPALVLISIVGIPVLFGAEFQDAVVPAVLLVAGSLATSVQTSLTRAATARSRPGVSLRSWTANTVVMLLLDLALIPPLGLVGAAVASGVGTGVGALVCLRWFGRELGLPAVDLLPRRADAAAIVAVGRGLVTPARRATRGATR